MLKDLRGSLGMRLAVVAAVLGLPSSGVLQPGEVEVYDRLLDQLNRSPAMSVVPVDEDPDLISNPILSLDERVARRTASTLLLCAGAKDRIAGRSPFVSDYRRGVG